MQANLREVETRFLRGVRWRFLNCQNAAVGQDDGRGMMMMMMMQLTGVIFLKMERKRF